MNEDKAYQYLLDNEIVSEETMQVVTNINGYNMKTFEDILYAVTGENSFDEEDEEDDE